MDVNRQLLSAGKTTRFIEARTVRLGAVSPCPRVAEVTGEGACAEHAAQCVLDLGFVRVHWLQVQDADATCGRAAAAAAALPSSPGAEPHALHTVATAGLSSVQIPQVH